MAACEKKKKNEHVNILYGWPRTRAGSRRETPSPISAAATSKHSAATASNELGGQKSTLSNIVELVSYLKE